MNATAIASETSSEAIVAEPSEPTAAEKFAVRLRRMADWLESHHAAANELMDCTVGRYRGPTIVLFKLASLAEAFPGAKAKKERRGESDVYSLVSCGITFEAWERRQPEPKDESEVVL